MKIKGPITSVAQLLKAIETHKIPVILPFTANGFKCSKAPKFKMKTKDGKDFKPKKKGD